MLGSLSSELYGCIVREGITEARAVETQTEMVVAAEVVQEFDERL